jgi:hypothetical protein
VGRVVGLHWGEHSKNRSFQILEANSAIFVEVYFPQEAFTVLFNVDGIVLDAVDVLEHVLNLEFG